MAETDKSRKKLFMGVDVGGTKIMAALAKPSGMIVGRRRGPTPREGTGKDVVKAILAVAEEVLAADGVEQDSLAAVGLAVPGVIDTQARRVLFSPNINIAGTKLAEPIEKKLGVPVALGNDVNIGTLGEKWLGAAHSADSAVGIFPGTGIGGGIIQDGRLLEGCSGAAGEIGHMIMQVDGPLCGCGAKGCFEALASRTAIERDLREAVQAGRKSVLTDLVDKDMTLIKSGTLKKALERGDALTTEVMTKASEVIGLACMSLLHLLDPDLVVLGGGVMEACDFFIMPIVENVLASDPLVEDGSSDRVAVSGLADDAVALGAVALTRQMIGDDPFGPVDLTDEYPTIKSLDAGEITIDRKTYEKDVFIRADGRVKRRDKVIAKLECGADEITVPELRKVCRGCPHVLLIGAGKRREVHLAEDAEKFLHRRNIAFEVLSSSDAVSAYNKDKGRKAALIRVS